MSKNYLLLILCFLILYNISQAQNKKGEITNIHYAHKLSSEIDTIEVTYIDWACACANWLLMEYIDEDYALEPEKYCVFIEASSPELVLPDKYHVGGNNNKIRFVGSYYEDKGISRDYIQSTSEIPKKTRVFRYKKVEIIKPYTVWDFSKKIPAYKVIKKEDKTAFK